MTAYLVRLGGLSLAGWFLVHFACGAAMTALTPAVVRLASRREAAAAARILLAARLTPLACSVAAVVLFCVPSYLWLEPRTTGESLGVECAVAAVLGLAVAAEAVSRGTRAALHAGRFARRCRWVGREEQIEGEPAAVLVLEQKRPCLALVGVTDPRIVVSRGVLTALSAEELSTALAHEGAHRDSRDNLKRLAVVFAPRLLPLVPSFLRLEREWAKRAEWAADDAAASGDALRPVTLAGALVRFARLGAAEAVPATATSMLSCHEDLAERVERLLQPPRARMAGRPAAGRALAIVAAVALGMVFALPASLPAVHRILEHLMD